MRDAGNWLGPLGAVAADLLLQIFGFAASLAFLAPLFVWGRAARCAANRLEICHVAAAGLAAGYR